MKIEKVVIPEAEPLNKEFTDNTFWSVDKTAEAEFDYDSLLAELEAWATPFSLATRETFW